jgi:ATP-dependent DNA ligase
VIQRPTIRPISLTDALKLSGTGFIAQEKMDGVFSIREWNGCTLAGERMRDGTFYAFDVATIQGDDCRRSPYRDRFAALQDIATRFDSSMRLPACGTGGEFLEAVLARGGEGVVFKNLEGFWGVGQWKAKRVETFDVIVTDIGRKSVSIAYEGQDAGRCPIYNQPVRVGDIIEIRAMKRTVNGKFREPQFVRSRPDKMLF